MTSESAAARGEAELRRPDGHHARAPVERAAHRLALAVELNANAPARIEMNFAVGLFQRCGRRHQRAAAQHVSTGSCA